MRRLYYQHTHTFNSVQKKQTEKSRKNQWNELLRVYVSTYFISSRCSLWWLVPNNQNMVASEDKIPIRKQTPEKKTRDEKKKTNKIIDRNEGLTQVMGKGTKNNYRWRARNRCSNDSTRYISHWFSHGLKTIQELRPDEDDEEEEDSNRFTDSTPFAKKHIYLLERDLKELEKKWKKKQKRIEWKTIGG